MESEHESAPNDAVLVYHNGDHWIVEYNRVFGHFENELDAIRAGRGAARGQLADLIVRDMQGRITAHERRRAKKQE